MDEIDRRVDLLRRLVEGTTNPYRRRSTETEVEHERAWAASSLLARLLQHAVPAHPPLDRKAAAGSLASPELLAPLEERGWVRWVLGRMEISGGGQMAVVHATGTTQEDISGRSTRGTTLGALETLIHLWDVREAQPLALEPTTTQELVGAHRRVHPDTPLLDELIAAGWFAQDGARVILRRNQGLLDRAAATLWLALTNQIPARGERFEAWFSRVGGDGAVDAPQYLPSEAKTALLDEMLERVLAEPDLGSWEAEWLRAVADRDDPRPGLEVPPEAPPASAGFTEILAHWQRIDQLLGGPAPGDVRRALDSLVHAIVVHDPLDGSVAARGRRIARLLDEGRRLPYLVRSVVQSILHSRPAAVAALLADPERFPLGVALLADLRLDDDAFLGWSDDPRSRHARRIRLVWGEGVDIALHTLARLPRQEAADHLAGILLPIARQATRDVYFTTQLRPRAEAELRLDETLALLERLEAPTLIDGRRAKLVPGLLSALVEAIRIRSCDESPPSGALRLLFWLLDADEREPTLTAAAIVKIVHVALSAPGGSWAHDHRALAALDWGRVARVLDAEGFGSLISPVPDTDRIEPRPLTNRRRLRMRILARVHAAVLEDPARRDVIESVLVGELVEFAPRAKDDPSNVFERGLEGVGFGPDVADLTRVIARTVDAFAPHRRDEAIRGWLGVTRDPALLLRSGSAMHGADARELVRSRLDQLDLTKVLEHESTVGVAAMVDDAIALHSGRVAERLLEAGDRVFAGRLRDRWMAESVEPRLTLAALTRNEEEFDRLRKSSGQQHEFARGLLQLHRDEVLQAVATFERLIEENPRSASAQVNLFAARLRAAQTAAELSSEDRLRQIEIALGAWRSAEVKLIPEDRERVSASSSYNVLQALDALGRDGDFDRQLEALPPQLRLNRQISELVAEVMRAREEVRRRSEERREAELAPLSPRIVVDAAALSRREQPAIDLLIFTALTQEAQVVDAVMSQVGTRRDELGELTLFDVQLDSERKVVVATACPHRQGAVQMGVFASPLLQQVRPRSAALVGIAAAVDESRVDLGDVPFASQIISYDDIALENSILEFRTDGYQVDSWMLRAAGRLKTSLQAYQSWRAQCKRCLPRVVDTMNALQKQQIKTLDVEPPHLLTEIGAGGPFLVRDRDFRDALRWHSKEQQLAGVRIARPVHPKLVFVEMESSGFMAAAHHAEVPATVIKGISDVGDQDKAKLEQETGGFFRVFACCNAALAALHILSYVRR